MGFRNLFTKKSSAEADDDSSNASSGSVTSVEFTNSSNSTEKQSGKTGSGASSVRSHSPPLSGPVSRQNSVSSTATVNSLARHASSTPSTHSTGGASIHTSHAVEATHLSRLTMLADGRHTHHLKNARRQEKLGKMIRDIMGSRQKVGNDAVSAVPEFVKQVGEQAEGRLTLMHGLVNRLANGEVEVGRVNSSTHDMMGVPSTTSPTTSNSSIVKCKGVSIKDGTVQSLAEKYGRCQEVIGRGSYGIVRVSHKTSATGAEQLYAVKEFRKRSAESVNSYQDRLMSEFCISSSLDHLNIIYTFDLMKDAHGGCCQIMEYCSGGDLYSLILSSGTGLVAAEADCFFKQILRGVVYMHAMGVAHCDLKPENILLTRDGVCKISDFGNAECFRMAWEKEVHFSRGVVGSGPYIAPEEYKDMSFDPRAIDIWAMGIIYMVMRTGSYLWRKAVADEDDNYAKYVRDRKTSKGYFPVERLSPSKSVYVIYSILDPVFTRRITGKQILNSEWGRSIKVCAPAELKDGKCPISSPASAASEVVKTTTSPSASRPTQIAQ